MKAHRGQPARKQLDTKGFRREDLLARVPHDAAVAEARRQGNPAQEPEPDLLPDQRRRPRGDPRRRRPGTCSPATTGSIPYYRDRALCLTLGMTPLEMLLGARRREGRSRTRGGRQMPSHWGHTELNIVSQSSPTGTQCLHGGRRAPKPACSTSASPRSPDRESQLQRRRSHLRLDRRRRDERRRVLGIAEHRLHRASCRCVYRRRRQRLRDLGAGRSADARRRHLARSSSRSPACIVQRCDGTDFLASYTRDGARRWPTRARARARRFVHAKVIRPYSHSLSDDEKLYKTAAERAAEAQARSDYAARDVPASRRSSRPTPSSTQIARGRRARGQRGGRLRAQGAPKPAADTATLYVYSPDVDPTSSRPSSTAAAARGQARHDGRGHQPHAEGRDGARPAHRRLRRGRRRREPRGGAARRVRQGRRLQGHARPAARVRQRPRLQLAARRSQHHRPRRRHGGARHQAGRRDPVLRLHLAGDDADARRDVDDALPLEQRLRRARW